MQKSKRAKRKKKPVQHFRWKVWGVLTTLVISITIVSLMLYCVNLSVQIKKHFSGRRWNIPSKVFSDITFLYPGQTLNRNFFDKKLRRLGYREVNHAPKHMGELRRELSFIELFLHDLRLPNRQRKGFPVRIKFEESKIIAIINLNDDRPIPVLELEPEELMLFYGPGQERRQVISINSLPQHVIFAILSAEDRRFYHHHGLDPRGIIRAVYTNLRHGNIRAGGSTITQQLAKCYFLTTRRTFVRKLKELFMSIIMEIMYDKKEILEIYLNEIYFGQKGPIAIHGIAEASFFYFEKPASELSVPEAATIAGLIKAPNCYSPYIDRERCRNRRDIVLRAMHANHWISAVELRNALMMPVETAGFKKYKKKAAYFIDYLSRQLKTLYDPETLTNLGLSIYTTLDTQVQMAAEQALDKGLACLEKSIAALNYPESEKKLQGAIVVLQPRSGSILAIAGGRNYQKSQFNRITQAKRQPGSAFKPFVYVSGLDRFTPASMLSNEPKPYIQDGKLWQPQNFISILDHRVSLRCALAKSINLATVDLAMQVGLESIVRTVKTFGFSTPLKPYPALALGAHEVIPLELARAYCAFAADGVLPYPLCLKAVIDENGNVLTQRHVTIQRVISPAKAFIMNSLLRSVVEEGTAQSLKNLGISFPVAGKTGTTNDYRDAWFVGYTPDILALVWVGYDTGASIDSTGATAAIPIWAELMKSIPQYISGMWFKIPPGVVQRTICSESRQLAIDKVCSNTKEEFFLTEKAPATYCKLHLKDDFFKKFFKGINEFFKKF